MAKVKLDTIVSESAEADIKSQRVKSITPRDIEVTRNSEFTFTITGIPSTGRKYKVIDAITTISIPVFLTRVEKVNGKFTLNSQQQRQIILATASNFNCIQSVGFYKRVMQRAEGWAEGWAEDQSPANIDLMAQFQKYQKQELYASAKYTAEGWAIKYIAEPLNPDKVCELAEDKYILPLAEGESTSERNSLSNLVTHFKAVYLSTSLKAGKAPTKADLENALAEAEAEKAKQMLRLRGAGVSDAVLAEVFELSVDEVNSAISGYLAEVAEAEAEAEDQPEDQPDYGYESDYLDKAEDQAEAEAEAEAEA